MQRIKPRFASKAELDAIARELTRRVMADKRIRAALSAPIAKSAPRPVLRARPVVKAAGTASSAATLAAALEGLQARLDGILASQKEARDSYTRKVDGMVNGLAKAHDALRKGVADIRAQSGVFHGIRADLSKVAERMTAAAARAPRRFQ